MRIIALLMCFFCFSTFANTKQELSLLLQNLHYGLKVEWDQKDQNFFKNEVEKFKNGLKTLIEKGMTLEEIQSSLKDQALNPEASQEIELMIKLNAIKNVNDLTNYIQKNPQHFYQRGASWRGDVDLVGIIVGSVIVALIVTALSLLLTYNWPSYVCTQQSSTQTCTIIDTDCMTYDEYGSCISYYTPYEYCEYPCTDGYYTEGGW